MGKSQEMVRQKCDFTYCVKNIRHLRKYYLYHLARSISTTKGRKAISKAIWRKYTSHTSIRGFLRKLVSSSRESICIILFLRTETDPYLHTLHLSKPALFHPCKTKKVLKKTSLKDWLHVCLWLTLFWFLWVFHQTVFFRFSQVFICLAGSLSHGMNRRSEAAMC